MQFLTNDSEILSPTLNQSIALRRHVRIKSSKLPPDFFMAPRSQRYVPSPIFSRQIGTDLLNRDIKTPSFHCRKTSTKLNQDSMDLERQVESARPSLEKIENDHELMSVVLSSTNRVRRLNPKQSLDLKQNCSFSMEAKDLRLPKILNRVAQRH